MSLSFEKSDFVSKELAAQDDLTTNYILIGLGIIIILFLSIITLKLFYKSKASKKNCVRNLADVENKSANQIQRGNQRAYVSSDTSYMDHFYRSLGDDYEEINDYFEIQSPIYLDYEKPISKDMLIPVSIRVKALVGTRWMITTLHGQQKVKIQMLRFLTSFITALRYDTRQGT